MQERTRRALHMLDSREQQSIHSKCSTKSWKYGCDPREEAGHRELGVCRQGPWTICFHSDSLTWLWAGGPSPSLRRPRPWLPRPWHVLTEWQLAPPRASDPRSNKQPSEVEVSHIVFSDLVLEVTLHRFCRLLLFTQTNCDVRSEGTAGGVRTRGRWEPPWSGYRTPIP